MASSASPLTALQTDIDRAPAIAPKERHGAVVVDSLREIAANKICTLLGRTEGKDLVDLHALLKAGIDLRTAVEDAQKKDGGVNRISRARLCLLASLLFDGHISHDFGASGERGCCSQA